MKTKIKTQKYKNITIRGIFSFPFTQFLRLPSGLQHLHRGKQSETAAILQPQSPMSSQHGYPSHAVTSIRLDAAMVIFSTTMAPNSPFSPMALHWQPE